METQTETPTTETRTDNLGLIQWRRTHGLDSADEQRRGWKCFAAFAAPQTQANINRYLGIVAGMNYIEPYSYDIVPFEEQARRVELKLGELINWGNPSPPRMPELPLDEQHLGIQWRGD